MRELADSARIRRFMQALGERAEAECRVYFTGGATAVLEGWRQQTIDADILVVPDSDRLTTTSTPRPSPRSSAASRRISATYGRCSPGG